MSTSFPIHNEESTGTHVSRSPPMPHAPLHVQAQNPSLVESDVSFDRGQSSISNPSLFVRTDLDRSPPLSSSPPERDRQGSTPSDHHRMPQEQMIEFVKGIPAGEDIDCESLLRKFFNDKTSAHAVALPGEGEGLIHEAVKRGWWRAADELLSRGSLLDFKKLNSMISDAAQYDNDQLNRVLRKHLDDRKREAGKTALGSPSLNFAEPPELSSPDYLPLPPRSTVSAPKHLSEIDNCFVASGSWMENTQTVKIHDNYMNWGTETRIENLIYLLDNLKKRERTLQHDLVDATDAKSGAKELLIQAHEILTGEEAKISDRIWLIRVLESEVRNVIEQLNDKVQALKSIQKMEIDNCHSSSSSKSSSSTSPSTSSPPSPPKDRTMSPSTSIYTSPSRNSSSFNFDPSSLERESSMRLNKLLNNANSISVTELHDRTLADIRNERGQVQSELLNIIEEREVLIQKLHKIQSLKAAASLPPSRPTDKIKMTRSPHLTPPSQAVFEKVDELDRERFQLDDITSSQDGGEAARCGAFQPRRSSLSNQMKSFDRESRASSSAASASRSISGGSVNSTGRSVVSGESTGTTNSEVFMPISPPLQMFDKQEVPSGDSMYRMTTLDSPVRTLKAQSVLSPRANNAITDAQSLLAAGLEKLWSSDKAAMQSIDELGKTAELREQTLERLHDAKGGGGEVDVKVAGGGYNSPPAVVFERPRQNSVVTMSARKLAYEVNEGEVEEEEKKKPMEKTASSELFDISLM